MPVRLNWGCEKWLKDIHITNHMLVSPSLISSDLRKLEDQVQQCVDAGATSFHLDVMDGHFVPNLTMGPDLVKAVRRSTNLPLESHLMIERPDKYYDRFVQAGSDTLLIHYESPVNLVGLFSKMEDEGVDHGLVVNPETPFSEVSDLISGSSILLIMSVHPGFSGQSFIDVLDKISEAASFIKENGLKTRIEVDGGINLETGKKSADAGADILVSASYIFSGNIAERVGSLKNL